MRTEFIPYLGGTRTNPSATYEGYLEVKFNYLTGEYHPFFVKDWVFYRETVNAEEKKKFFDKLEEKYKDTEKTDATTLEDSKEYEKLPRELEEVKVVYYTPKGEIKNATYLLERFNKL